VQGLPEGKIPLAINLQLNPVNVELPLQAGLPAAYVPDKTVRLGLYRRMADLRSLNELDALGEEFKDRFGLPPEAVQNLFYQLKVKLLAEQAGLVSIVVETGQIVLRFDEGDLPEDLPDLGPYVRAGKVALWLGYKEALDWQTELLQVLDKLAHRVEHA